MEMSFKEALARYPSRPRGAKYREPPEIYEWVYFITDGEAIKIGKAEFVERRIASLQTGHHKKLVLLGKVPGGQSQEAALHRRWRHLRIRGEWFRDDPAIRYFVEHGWHPIRHRSSSR